MKDEILALFLLVDMPLTSCDLIGVLNSIPGNAVVDFSRSDIGIWPQAVKHAGRI